MVIQGLQEGFKKIGDIETGITTLGRLAILQSDTIIN